VATVGEWLPRQAHRHVHQYVVRVAPDDVRDQSDTFGELDECDRVRGVVAER
jgi:hypothetical protein